MEPSDRPKAGSELNSLKNYLNRLESYIMKNWTNIWGYNKKNIMDIDNLRKCKKLNIYIQIADTINKPHLINQLEDTIKDNITELKKYVPNIIITKKVGVSRNFGIKEAWTQNQDYYWLIDTTYIITKKKGYLLSLFLYYKHLLVISLV